MPRFIKLCVSGASVSNSILYFFFILKMSLNENSLLNGKECYENHEEYQYINHIKNIMKNGVEMKDRTGVGTLSIFGAQMKWSLKDGKLNFFKNEI